VKRRSGVVLALAAIAGVGGQRPSFASGLFTVGSFTKSTSGAPVSQSVAHGLGVAPKAVILWTNGKTSTTLGANFLFGFGMTDGSTDGSIACSSADNQSTTSANRRIASKAMTILNGSGTLQAEADLSSFDATNFTLNWTTNNATAYVIHFIAIGGSGISAKVVSWGMKTSTGNQSVTGVGFQPDVVIHANAGTLISSIPTTTTHLAPGISVMDRNGNQWSNCELSVDNVFSSDTQRYQRSNKCLGVILNDLTLLKEASYVSMDTDGFTINYSTSDSGTYKNGEVVSLALKGVRTGVGCFTKSTGGAPASQPVTGLSFKPNLVLLTSVQNTATTSVVAHSRFGIGASDGTTSGSSAWTDTDNLSTSSTDGVDKTTKVFMKINNNTPAIDAEADMTSLDDGGFTLDWTTNDGVATEICYLALAGPRRVMIVQ
jgi:hypothetical protein